MTRKKRSYFAFAFTALLLVVGIESLLLLHNIPAALNWNPFVFLLVLMALGAAIGVLIHFSLLRLSSWIFGIMQMGEHTEIGGHFLGVIGVIYAVVLAFVVVTAWQEYDHTQELVVQEQRAVNTLFHTMGAYVQRREAADIQWLLRDYSANTFREWQQMRSGEHPVCPDFVFRSDIGTAIDNCPVLNARLKPPVIDNRSYPLKSTNCLAHDIMRRLADLTPVGAHDAIVYRQSLDLAESFVQDRNDRQQPYETPPLPTVLWLSFPLGALILIIVTYFVANQDSRSQMLRTTALCSMISMMAAMALIFDHPFTGSAQIRASGWSSLVTNFHHEIEVVGTSRTPPPQNKTNVAKRGGNLAQSGGGTTPQEPDEVIRVCSIIPPQLEKLKITAPARD